MLSSEMQKPEQRQWRHMQQSSAGCMAQVLTCCEADAGYAFALLELAAVCSCLRQG